MNDVQPELPLDAVNNFATNTNMSNNSSLTNVVLSNQNKQEEEIESF